ncbi:MAG TPA: glycosyltransferase, partial [Planctomycetes bacterium]|nr:glycosyltransferase [Planctomycetota bacterium]
MDLSVVVLSWNTRDLVRDCLEALEKDQFPGSREVLLVDQASSDGTAHMVRKEFPRVRLVQAAENLGYARGNNLGAEKARGKRLCLLGSDTRVRPGALEGLTAFLEENPEYGAAAPKLVGAGGEVQRACMNFPGIFTALTFDNIFSRFPPGKWIQDRYYMRSFDHLSERDVVQPPGTCLVLSREEYLAMG